MFAGQLPDGRRVDEQVAVFARGARIYQATAVGARLDVDAAESFIGSLRLSP
jgi:ribosomal protein L1